MAQNFVHVPFRHHRAQLRARIQGIACHHSRGLGHEGIAEPIVDGTLHQDSGAAQADLTLVGERTAQGDFQGFVEIGILENDGWIFSSKFKAHLLELRRHVASDPCTGRSAPRERHRRHVRVSHHGLTHFRAQTMQDVEDPIRETGFLDPRAQEIRRDGCHFRRFGHHTIAGGQGRRNLPREEVKRQIPRTDARHNTEGLRKV